MAMKRFGKWSGRLAAILSILGLPGTIVSMIESTGKLWMMAECARAADCSLARFASAELRWFGLWSWRGVSLLLFGIGLGLFVLWLRHRPVDRLTRLERKTARARLHDQIAELLKLQEEGNVLRRAYRPREPRIDRRLPAMVTPIEDIRPDGHEFYDWSGPVLWVLKRVGLKDIENYFQQCLDAEGALPRMICWQKRLDGIITRLRRRLVFSYVRWSLLRH